MLLLISCANRKDALGRSRLLAHLRLIPTQDTRSGEKEKLIKQALKLNLTRGEAASLAFLWSHSRVVPGPRHLSTRCACHQATRRPPISLRHAPGRPRTACLSEHPTPAPSDHSSPRRGIDHRVTRRLPKRQPYAPGRSNATVRSAHPTPVPCRPRKQRPSTSRLATTPQTTLHRDACGRRAGARLF